MARPRLAEQTAQYRVTLSLRPGEDDDLIVYLDQARAAGTPLAQAIVTAMRGGLGETAVSTSSDDALIDDLLDMVF